MKNDITNTAAGKKGPVVLIIMDGLGNAEDGPWNAVTRADAPYLNALIKDSKQQGKYTALRTDGGFVGLPGGQMGNSEVGHSTLGAGRIIEQPLTSVHKKLEDGSLFDSDGVQTLVKSLKESKGSLQLFGLLSDGGVHSHIEHIVALAKHFDKEGVPVVLHLALDGRDVAPESAKQYLTQIHEELKGNERTTIGTLSGRAYSMDRDKKWDRIKPAYDAIVFGRGAEGSTPLSSDKVDDYLAREYQDQRSRGVTPSDENIRPVVMEGYPGIGPQDGLLVANFRTDRAKEISQALIDPASLSAQGFEQKFAQGSEGRQFARGNATGMTEYSDDHAKLMQSVLVVPEEEKPQHMLSEVIAAAGRAQLHLAESEKYPHVTRFFDGRDKPVEGEEVVKVASPALAPGETYARVPAMSSEAVTETLKTQLAAGKHDFIVVNYAQPDMVGHTGDFDAARGAVEAMDRALAEIIPLIKRRKGTAIVIADHGNVEQMRFADGVTPHTQHTTNPVHMMLVGGDKTLSVPAGGEAGLADIAPTVLELMGLAKPQEMTGESRISQVKQRGV